MKQFSEKDLNLVFHAYDIRGRSPEELDAEFFYQLGAAFSTYLNAKKIFVGHDIRPDGAEFSKSFIQGVIDTGADVVFAGEIATEMVYLACGSDETFDGGVTITASHNPAGWNGCKMVKRHAAALSKTEGLPQIKEIILNQSFKFSDTKGDVAEKDIYPEFKEKILTFLEGVEIKNLKVIVDAGNGIGGKIFDYVFGDLDIKVEKMYFEPDGNFPNHVPDPLKEENVAEIKLRTKNEKADIGIAIDGDADRVFFIDNKGRNPSGVYTGSIFARELLKENPGRVIIHDPRVTWPMSKEILKVGGKPIPSVAGHSFFKQMMKKHDGIFGAEVSSHFYYHDFYYADAGMVTIALMLKFLAEGLDFTSEMDHFYDTYPNSGEVNYEVGNHPEILSKIESIYSEAKIEKLDGVSIEFDDWRFNLRPSNTQPLLRLNVEAKNIDLLKEKFKEVESLIGGKRDNLPSLEELR